MSDWHSLACGTCLRARVFVMVGVFHLDFSFPRLRLRLRLSFLSPVHSADSQPDALHLSCFLGVCATAMMQQQTTL